ncbi:hypothetical protein HMPREF0305_10665 [Corynebacterium pseudogenitalium ATCC 33035]|uniref:Uncharacterized protein n=1 Tax=Corynebacterium pseudogenitalium ATCC 33035 TaxID=525264 RepID=E2S2E2_9CORY|nr:hypothetical protein HMPREF0305_10665 [Corynebacterium pseudogenitalium ATCC 33035]
MFVFVSYSLAKFSSLFANMQNKHDRAKFAEEKDKTCLLCIVVACGVRKRALSFRAGE